MRVGDIPARVTIDEAIELARNTAIMSPGVSSTASSINSPRGLSSRVKVKKAIRASVRQSKWGLLIGLLASPGTAIILPLRGVKLAQAKTIYVAKFGNHTRFTGLNGRFIARGCAC